MSRAAEERRDERAEALMRGGADESESGGGIDEAPRCWCCRRLLAASLARPWSMDCPRCGMSNGRGPGRPR